MDFGWYVNVDSSVVTNVPHGGDIENIEVYVFEERNVGELCTFCVILLWAKLL